MAFLIAECRAIFISMVAMPARARLAQSRRPPGARVRESRLVRFRRDCRPVRFRESRCLVRFRECCRLPVRPGPVSGPVLFRPMPARRACGQCPAGWRRDWRDAICPAGFL